MKVKFDVSDTCTLEAEVKGIKEGFSFIAYAQEIFGVKKCGNCGSPNLRFRVRTPQGYTYRDIKCQDCGHELKISEQKPETGGRLYPAGWEAPYSGDEDSPPKRRRQQGPTYHNQDNGDDDWDKAYEQASGRRQQHDDGIDF